MPTIGEEVVERRGENLKTFYLGNKYRASVASHALHYKHNYADKGEPWKDIDLTWDGKRLTTAPYILDIVGDRVNFTDKKTGGRVTITIPVGVTSIPFEEGVKLQRTFKSLAELVAALPLSYPIERIGSPIRVLSSGQDATGLAIPITLAVTDTLTESVDLTEGKLKTIDGNDAIFPITIDPSFTVQPSSKDNRIQNSNPTTNYGTETFSNIGKGYFGDVNYWLGEFTVAWGVDIPAGAIITGASLQLWMYQINSLGMATLAQRLLRTDWHETQSTWNIYKTSNNWTTAGALSNGNDFTSTDQSSSAVPAAHTWMTFNDANMVNQIQTAQTGGINPLFKVRLTSEGTNNRTFAPANREDGTAASRPKLTIDYIAGGSSPAQVSQPMGAKMIAGKMI